MTTEAVRDTAVSRRLSLNRLGLWLFILSESMIFLALLTARVFLEGTDVPEEADQTIALVITSVLLLSSGSAYGAEAAAVAGRWRVFSTAMGATLLLGLIFLVGVGFEWAEALHAFPPSSAFGTVFFTMTGMHAFHVVTGLVFLLIIFFQARRGAYDDGNVWPVEAGVKYWHFVDVVWVFFYPALYLVS